MTPDTKAALKKSLTQEDAALRERLALTPASAAPVAQAETAPLKSGAPKAPAEVVKAKPAKREVAPAPAKKTPVAKPAVATPAAPKARAVKAAASVPASATPAPAPVKAKPEAKAKAKAVKVPAVPAPVKEASAAEVPKVIKVSRESFSLPATEAATLKALRTALARGGRITTKSELVRAGIQLLNGLTTVALLAAVDGLAPVAKKKKKK